MLTAIKKFLWEYHFKRNYLHVKRQRDVVNLTDAKTVVILFELTSEDDYYRINSFVKTLQSNQKIVNALGFYTENVLPSYCSRRLSYDFISPKDLNWFGIPSKSFINDFVRKECDLLIDLSMKENKTLQYIAGLSRAKMKVGRHSDESTRYYDMMFITDNLKDVEAYIQNVIQYLSGLNKIKPIDGLV